MTYIYTMMIFFSVLKLHNIQLNLLKLLVSIYVCYHNMTSTCCLQPCCVVCNSDLFKRFCFIKGLDLKRMTLTNRNRSYNRSGNIFGQLGKLIDMLIVQKIYI